MPSELGIKMTVKLNMKSKVYLYFTHIVIAEITR